MLSENDLHWLAGLLEGEGFFGAQHSDRRWASPIIQLNMTDLDIVTRAAVLLGGAGEIREVGQRPGHKTQYRFRLGGRRAAAWMMMLHPLMGERRQQRIEATLKAWEGRLDYATTYPSIGVEEVQDL